MKSPIKKAIFDLSVIGNHGISVHSGQMDNEHCAQFVTEYFDIINDCLRQRRRNFIRGILCGAGIVTVIFSYASAWGYL